MLDSQLTMINVNLRFQIASFFFLAIMVFNYLRKNRLPIISTKCYSLMLASAGVNLLFDIITVITLAFYDELPLLLNEVCHKIFYLSIAMLLFFLYLYVLFLTNNQRRMSNTQWLIRAVPLFISVCMILFGNIEYITNSFILREYTSGLSAMGTYVGALSYILLTIINVVKSRLRNEKKIFIITGVSMWLVAGAVQFCFPHMLVSGLAITMLMMFLHLSFENPLEYRDEETETFNKYGFTLMLNEKIGQNKPFTLVTVVSENLSSLQNKIGRDECNRLLNLIAGFINEKTGVRVYHTRGNGLSFFSPYGDDEINECLECIIDRFHQTWNLPNGKVSVLSHIDIQKYPEDVQNVDEVFDMINFMASTHHENDEKRVFAIDDELLKSKNRENTIFNMLNDAIINDGIDVFYQPIYSIKDGCFRSAEALVRLKDNKTIGFVSPEEFIPIAEQKGLIMELGAIIFEKVCKFASEQDLQKYGIHYIEVNLSGIQCTNTNLPAQLSFIICKYNLPYSFINLEITETAAVENGKLLMTNMDKLREMGCSFSMDDFGTGYSNLSKIAEVSYDLIKLDKSLIWPCFREADSSTKRKAEHILRDMVTLAHHLEIKIVAEGVETNDMVDLLSDIGVQYLQGYYFSRPVCEMDFIEKISK